jgi:hypothetical protein
MQNALPKRQAKFVFLVVSLAIKPKFCDDLLFSIKEFLSKSK